MSRTTYIESEAGGGTKTRRLGLMDEKAPARCDRRHTICELSPPRQVISAGFHDAKQSAPSLVSFPGLGA